MVIAVPSKNRAGYTTTQKWLPDAVFYVPESEVHQYKAVGIRNIVGVPIKVKGITATRNYILSNTTGEDVVMIDDDVMSVQYVDWKTGKQPKLNTEQIIKHLEQGFDVCKGLGYKIWGPATEGSKLGSHPYKPFMLKTYVLGTCFCVVNDGWAVFDEEFPVKEDYELCLRHIKEFGGTLGVRHWSVQCKHWVTDGGCKDYRTIEMEERCIKMLKAKYPSMVKEAKRKNNMFTIKLTL